MAEKGLVLENLTVQAQGRVILQELNWSWRPGAIKVLLGPNGAGKSTLAKTIAGLPECEQIGGKKVDKWKAFKKSELGIRNIYTTKRIKIQKNEVIHKSYAHFG